MTFLLTQLSYPWVSEDAGFLDEKRFSVVILFCSCRRFWQYGETFTIVISTAYQDAGTSWVRNFSLNSLFNLMCGSHIVNLTCHLNQYSNFNRYKKQNKNPVMEKLTILIGLGDLHLSVVYEYDNNLFDA